MITLNILQFLIDNNIGTALDIDMFFEKLPLNKNGIAIYSRGGTQAYGRNTKMQSFDLYSRGTSDVTGYKILTDIRNLLSETYGKTCELPSVTGYNEIVYKNIQFTVIDNIENIGQDENDRVIYRLGASVIYKIEETIV